jgi:hypothetical protein
LAPKTSRLDVDAVDLETLALLGLQALVAGQIRIFDRVDRLRVRVGREEPAEIGDARLDGDRQVPVIFRIDVAVLGRNIVRRGELVGLAFLQRPAIRLQASG